MPEQDTDARKSAQPTAIMVESLRESAPEIYDALIKRGWSRTDTIRPDVAFNEFCSWHGLVGWGPALRDALERLGWRRP